MNVAFRIHDTTQHLDRIIPTLNGVVKRVAKRVGGEMERGAKKALKSPALTSPKRIGEGTLVASIRNVVEPIDTLAYRAIVGTNVSYAPYVEFGTGPRGARDYPVYAYRYGWPGIQYTLPRIRARTASVLSWNPRGKGTHIASSVRLGAGRAVETGRYWRKGGKTTFIRRVAVRWTRGMHAHPFLTPQPFAIKDKAQGWLSQGLEDAWNGRRAA